MHFHVFCKDVPDGPRIRKEALAAHMTHIEQTLGSIHVAGPLLDEADIHVGSMMVIEARDLATARTMVETDPYFKAGLWKSIEITRVWPVAGAWVGGKNW